MNENTMINITDTEQKLFDLVLDVCKKYELKTIIRVAGGWVRDKLLNKVTHDIDLTLDDITGANFANYINKYLTTLGEKEIRISVIKLNPEKSKHLETATFRMDKLDVDLTNLRAESYNENSRIPIMKFGTAHEDALRRDFTINSLFYNLNSKKIEDFTKNGLNDLKIGIIRSPYHHYNFVMIHYVY